MAIKNRYRIIDDLPEAGVQLACTPALYNHLNVLNEAWQNNATLNGGASYNESDKPTREISYVYALNSVYRDLLQWQKQYPEEEIIPQMRQDICDMFPYFMQNEFPQPEDAETPNFEINEDAIQIDSKDPISGEIIDPQEFELDEEHQQALADFLNNIDTFIESKYPTKTVTESEKADEEQPSAEEADKDDEPAKVEQVQSEEPEKVEQVQDKELTKEEDQASAPAQAKENTLSKRLRISSDFIRKMQFYLARKAQGRKVYDFRTTEEKSRTFRNGFIKNIENVLQAGKNEDVSFDTGTQTFCNFLDSNGMQMVWYQEPPYEAEFVNHLDEMKQDLAGDTPDDFYTTKLPIFLDLCKNLQESNPEETAALQTQMQDFLSKPSKEKLLGTIEEAKRVSLELQMIDEAKSKSMRAAWNGIIANPPRKRLSPFLQDLLQMRERLGSTNVSAEMQQKIAAYAAKRYTAEDYDFSQCKIWNICKQVPQFKPLEQLLFNKISALSVPPEKIASLTYDDVAYLLNNALPSRNKFSEKNDGLAIASDKSRYLKTLVKNNEKELRKSLQSYYQQKFTMQLVNDGIAQKKSDVKIQKKVAAEAAKATEKVISDMQKGIANEDFNGHHIFALSNISYFEKATGLPFTKINDYIVMINEDFHDLIHMNENNVDFAGKIRMEQNVAHRTKYIPRQNILRQGKDVIGYIGRAMSFTIVTKPGIKFMADFRSFIFDKEQHLKNIEVQQQLIDCRKAKKNKMNKLTVPHLSLNDLCEYLKGILQPALEISINTKTELQKARELDKMNQERRHKITEVVDKTPEAPKTLTQKKQIGHFTRYTLQQRKLRKK